jgi:hypothetical protein
MRNICFQWGLVHTGVYPHLVLNGHFSFNQSTLQSHALSLITLVWCMSVQWLYSLKAPVMTISKRQLFGGCGYNSCHWDWVLDHCSKRVLASCTHAGGRLKWKTVHHKALMPEYCNGIRLNWKICKMSMSAVMIFTKMENLEWLDWKKTSNANDVKGCNHILEGRTS